MRDSKWVVFRELHGDWSEDFLGKGSKWMGIRGRGTEKSKRDPCGISDGVGIPCSFRDGVGVHRGIRDGVRVSSGFSDGVGVSSMRILLCPLLRGKDELAWG